MTAKHRTSDPVGRVTVRAYGPLNDFLSPGRRSRPFERTIDGSPAVKDVIEATGIPHPEVGLVLVDGEPVTFEHHVTPGARVAVFPPFRSIELGDAVRPNAAASVADEAAFVLDGHLGRLAAYLRMCGFDTWYERAADDDRLAAVAAGEHRILLTRDRGLLKRSIVARGAYVRSDQPARQLVEVLDRFELAGAVRPFARCLRCNAPLEPFERSAARELVPPRVHREQAEFRACPACGRLFWRGSHRRRMERLLDWALEQAGGGPASDPPA